MSNEIIFIAAIIFAFFGAIFYFFSKKMKELTEAQKKDGSFLMLQNQINDINKNLHSRLDDSQKAIRDQAFASQKIIREVTERLTQINETNKQVVNFADQLHNLQELLKNPKQRGILGEYYLETLLKNTFSPNQFKMQYRFSGGEIVDAAIFIQEKIIPVDSKFSLDNYNKLINEKDENKRAQIERAFKQDLKNRIDETSKYINHKENTTDYAFMFIPAEAIYYDLLVGRVGGASVNARDLLEYANREKKVIIVSPTTFYAYLQLFVEGLRMIEIDKSVKDVIKRVGILGKHIASFSDYMARLGTQLGTTVNTYNTAYHELGKIDKDIFKISGGGGGITPEKIEKPSAE